MSNAKNLATFLQSGGSIAGDANFDSNTLFVDASANAVGIGTSSPDANLEIKNTSATLSSPHLKFEGSGGADDDFAIYAPAGGNTLRFGYDHTSLSQDNILVLDSSGIVGIGTSSTTNDAKLIISGTDGKHPIIKVSDGGGNGYTLLADNYTASESQINFGISYSGAGAVISRGVKVSDTTDNVYLSSQGLYATKPTALKLDNDGSFRFLNTNTNATTAVDTAVSLTERMRIESGGNIGIGTSSVSSLGTGITTIELKGNSASQSDRSGGIRFTRYDGNDGMYIYNADGASYIESRSTYPLLITTNGTERMRVGTSELVVNEGANNFDFRVETQNSTNGFFIDASVDRIVMASGASEDSTLTINAQSSSGTITHVSNSSIPGTGTGKVQEGVYTISGNSSNSILSIPIFSQTNVWRSFLVELRFITGEYNKSGGPLGGYGLIEFHTLNGFAQFNTIERTGNISSFSTSGTTLKVNFTTAYTGGLNNHEGVIMYAKVLSGHPSYIEFDNATFN